MSLLVTGRGESVSCYTFIFVNTLSRFVIRLKYPDWFLLYFHVREVLRCSFYCNLVFLIENFMMWRKRAKFLRLDRFERFHLPLSQGSRLPVPTERRLAESFVRQRVLYFQLRQSFLSVLSDEMKKIASFFKPNEDE